MLKNLDGGMWILSAAEAALKAKGLLFYKIYTSVKTQFCSFASVYHHSGFLRLSTLSQWI